MLPGFTMTDPTPLSTPTSDMVEEEDSMQCGPTPTPKGCKLCHTDHQAKFLGKIAIHPLESLDDSAKPMVWVFTKVSICLDCGHAEIRFSESRGITFQ